jgi:exodeoxyribonuclease VII large subunit
MIPVIIYPTLVQGEGAAGQIARAIERANQHARCDVLIVCRGGGSLEDLWAYNEEVVARAIVGFGDSHRERCRARDRFFDRRLRRGPARGHSDGGGPRRQALSGAALLDVVAAARRRLGRDMDRVLERATQRVDVARRRLLTPAERVARQRERLGDLLRRLRRALPDIRRARGDNERRRMLLRSAFYRTHAGRAALLDSLRASLAHLDPTKVLSRGYSIVRGPDGHVVRSSEGLAPGSKLDIAFSEGGAEAEVTRQRVATRFARRAASGVGLPAQPPRE